MVFSISNQQFSPIQKLAFYTVYNSKCGYLDTFISIKDMEIDHIIPERVLNNPKENEFMEWRKKYSLDKDFSITGYENLICSSRDFNRKKHDHGLHDKDHLFDDEIRKAIWKAKMNKKRIEEEIDKLEKSFRKYLSIEKIVKNISHGELNADELIEAIYPYISHETFEELIQKTPFQEFEPIINIKLQEMIDEYNRLIEQDFHCIKKLFFPNGAGLGVDLTKNEYRGIRYLISYRIFPIQPNNFRFKQKIVGFKDKEDWKQFPNLFGENTMSSKSAFDIVNNPQQFAFDLVFEIVKELIESKILLHSHIIHQKYVLAEYISKFLDWEEENHIPLSHLQNQIKSKYSQIENWNFALSYGYDSKRNLGGKRIIKTLENFIEYHISNVKRYQLLDLVDKKRKLTKSELKQYLEHIWNPIPEIWKDVIKSNFSTNILDENFWNKKELHLFIPPNEEFNLNEMYGFLNRDYNGLLLFKDSEEEFKIIFHDNPSMFKTLQNENYRWGTYDIESSLKKQFPTIEILYEYLIDHIKDVYRIDYKQKKADIERLLYEINTDMHNKPEVFYRMLMFDYLSIGSDEFYSGDYYNARINLKEAVHYFEKYFELNEKDRNQDQYHLDRALKLLKEIDEIKQKKPLQY